MHSHDLAVPDWVEKAAAVVAVTLAVYGLASACGVL